MSDCRFGVSPVNYPDPDPELNFGFDQADQSNRLEQKNNKFNIA